MTDLECDYCETDELVYELNSGRGPVTRCIPCLAIEQGQQQINMRFDRFVDFDAGGVVYDTDGELRESRKNSFDVCKSWWRVLARWKQDDPFVKRDPEGHEPTLHEWTREFLTNTMGSAAHYSPSEIIDSDGDPGQTTITDGGSSDLEELSTHDLVGKALSEHDDQESKDGIPTGDVVDWIVSRTELVRADVHDAIGWLHDRGHVYEPQPDHLRRTKADSERWLAVAWHEALVETRVEAGDLDPRYLVDRYGAETPTEVDELVQQAVKEVIRGDNEKLTLDDLDAAEEKLEEAGYEAVTDGGFHSGDHHVLYDDQSEPEPSLEDLCTEDGCTETGHGRCGCCGMSLCGRHNEVQGGFCSNFERVAGVPGCLVWSSEFHIYQRAFYDSEVEVREFNGIYCLEEDGEPLCGSDHKRLERVELQDIDHEYDLCSECEDVAIDRLAEDEDGGESA